MLIISVDGKVVRSKMMFDAVKDLSFPIQPSAP